MEEPVPSSIEELDLFGESVVDNLTNGMLAVLEPEISRVLHSVNELVWVVCGCVW